jgi:hypothetical protein
MTKLRRRTPALGAVFLLAAATLFGQQPEPPDVGEAIEEFLNGALTVHINARIVDEDQNVTVWTMDLTRVTISGRSVRVRLDGSNIAVEAEFTPYWEDEDQLMLVAQGRTWLTGDDPTAEPDYRTSFTTLPIQLGEPIVFLPLGSPQVPVDTDRFGRLNIELEINVERYQS